MSYRNHSALAAAVLGLTMAVAMPAHAAPNKDDCKARFAEVNQSRDMRLDSEQGKKYTEVASQVDVNKDGMISADEYIVACTKDVFKGINETG